MKMIPATCGCGVEFLKEPHDQNPRCDECFWTHDVPDLKILTDQVSTEEQRGPNRQEENRAAGLENLLRERLSWSMIMPNHAPWNTTSPS